jgi:SAM-dependent methyltransferase
MSWWHTFFDDDYAQYGLASTPPDQIKRIVDFLVATLELKAGQRVFDQCCGIGRLSIPLAERGMEIIGVDLTEGYVRRAQAAADARHLPCTFFHGDAFEFHAPQPCDAALNWFTSFGYCEDDAQNMRMMQRVFESLKPGGRFVIDYVNIPKVFGEFRTSFVDRPAVPGLEGMLVITESRPRFESGMMDMDWTFVHADGRRVVKSIATRMFMPDDLVRMLRCCGFEQVRLIGSADGEPYERTSRRCIIAARKPI